MISPVPPSPPDPRGPARLDFNTPALRRRRRWRALQDRLIRGSVLAGGLAVLAHLTLIFFYLAYVVLPLLQAVVVPVGLVSDGQVMAGYGLAQAVPGPLFTFAAYLGALVPAALPAWLNGLLWTLLIFLPGALILLAALPFWQSLRQHPGWQRALTGLNAGVVGLLLAALYDPVWTGAIRGPLDVALARAGAPAALAHSLVTDTGSTITRPDERSTELLAHYRLAAAP